MLILSSLGGTLPKGLAHIYRYDGVTVQGHLCQSIELGTNTFISSSAMSGSWLALGAASYSKPVICTSVLSSLLSYTVLDNNQGTVAVYKISLEDDECILQQVHRLTTPAVQVGASFGSSVAMNGNLLFVGVPSCKQQY
jgi:hypothetical protein